MTRALASEERERFRGLVEAFSAVHPPVGTHRLDDRAASNGVVPGLEEGRRRRNYPTPWDPGKDDLVVLSWGSGAQGVGARFLRRVVGRASSYEETFVAVGRPLEGTYYFQRWRGNPRGRYVLQVRMWTGTAADLGPPEAIAFDI